MSMTCDGEDRQSVAATFNEKWQVRPALLPLMETDRVVQASWKGLDERNDAT